MARPDTTVTETTLKDRLLYERITLSQELMREKHEDYDEMEAEFVELAKADPSLIQKMRSAALPATFAYHHAVAWRLANPAASHTK